MKSFLLIVFSLIPLAFRAFAQEYADNAYVRLEVAASPAQVAAGDSVTVLLRFSPADDIHLNADPAVQVQLDPSSPFKLHGQVRQTVDERTGYLAATEPVSLTLLADPGISPGTHTVGGTITYFYCSGAEGWCMRWKQNVAIKVVVPKGSPSDPRSPVLGP